MGLDKITETPLFFYSAQFFSVLFNMVMISFASLLQIILQSLSQKNQQFRPQHRALFPWKLLYFAWKARKSPNSGNFDNWYSTLCD